MSSHDLRWSIERYPSDTTFSYGCPDLDLMGFLDIDELLIHMLWKIKELERGDKKK